MQILSLAVSATLAFFCASALAQDAAKPASVKHPVVVIQTSMGNIEMTLDAERAPLSVQNFLSYVSEAFYDSTIFHRVIKGFMIQGGGFTIDMVQKPTKPPIKNEAGNGLKNKRGTIAMARTGIINSATCQFFINHEDSDFLDHTDETPKGFGYAVFGQVTKGMDVVDKIASVATGSKDVPRQPIVILSIRVISISEEFQVKSVVLKNDPVSCKVKVGTNDGIGKVINVEVANKTQKNIVATEIRAIYYSVFNDHIYTEGLVWTGNIGPDKKVDSYSKMDFSNHDLVHTIITFVSRVKFEDGTIWKQDIESLVDEVSKFKINVFKEGDLYKSEIPIEKRNKKDIL